MNASSTLPILLVMLPFLLLILAIVAGLCFRATRRPAMIVGGVLLLLVFSLMWVRTTSPTTSIVTAPPPQFGYVVDAELEPVEPTPWEPPAELRHSASAHYTLEDAATALVSRLTVDQLELGEVRLHVSPVVSAPIRDAVLAALKARFVGAEVTSVVTDAPVLSPPPGERVNMVLSTPQVFTRRNTGSLSDGARIRLAVISSSQSSHVETEYHNKPWAAPGSWMDPVPGRHFALGWSTSPASTMDEAMRQAQRFAARSLANRLIVSGQAGSLFPGMSEPALRQLLEGAIQSRQLPREDFIQNFRSGRLIWRAAVLVDTSNEQLHSLRHPPQTYTRTHTAHPTVRGGRIGIASIIGVLALILLLYFALNAWTRGHFENRLRFLAASLFLLAVVLVMLMA